MINKTTKHLLCATKLQVGYHGKALLPPIDLDIHAGETWLLLGPNGSGKSTLVQTLLGLIPPVQGTIELAPSIRCGYMEQKRFHDETIPSRAIDLIRSGQDRNWSFLNPSLLFKQKEILKTVLHDTNVSEIAQFQFNQLSEGQKQRVLLAQTLVSEPNFLVLDEPTSAMDPHNESKVFDLLKTFQQKHNMAIFMVSHQITALPQLATHAIFLDQECNVALCGTVDQIIQSNIVQTHYGQLLGSIPPHQHPEHTHLHK